MKFNAVMFGRWVGIAFALVIAVPALFILFFLLKPIDQASTNTANLGVPTAQDQALVVKLPSSTPPTAVNESVELISSVEVAIDSEASLDPALEPTNEALPGEVLSKALHELAERTNADTTELNHPSVGANDDYLALRQEMLHAISEDPLLMDTLIELFKQDPHSKIGREIAEVLAITGAPEAQTMALDIAADTGAYDHEDRSAALLLITEMDTITSDTRDRLLVNIQQETESDLTQFSLMGLKRTPSTVEEYANVQGVLNETLNRDDEHVRRHAASQIENWATSDEDLAPLRVMALEEADINARIRAVMSIGVSEFKSAENKSTLYEVIATDEEAVIRYEAWVALENFQLTDAEKSDYESLGERLEEEVEAWKKSYLDQGA